MQTDTSPTTVVQVDPPAARVDEPFRLTVSGLPPGKPVTIRAATRDGELREWASNATFLAGDDGTVDGSTAAPPSGTVSEAALEGPGQDRPGGRELASCDVERTFGGEGVLRRAADGRGLAGDLF